MSGVLRKLGDFNEVLEYYQYMINIVLNINGIEKYLNNLSIMRICYNRAILNNIGISIAQNFEYIEKNKTSTIDEDILKELKEMPTEFANDFREMMRDNKLTPFETLKQIRNTFLHGNYELEFGTPNSYRILQGKECPEFLIDQKIKVNIKSKKMKGTFNCTLTSLVLELENFFESIRLEEMPNNKFEFYFSNSKVGPIKNRITLEKSLDEFKEFRIIPSEELNSKNKLEIVKDVYNMIPVKSKPFAKKILNKLNVIERTTGKNRFKIQPLDEKELEERKQYIREYVQYVGFKNWEDLQNLGQSDENIVYEDFLGTPYEHTSFAGISNRFCLTIRQLIKNKYENPFENNNKFLNDKLIMLKCETPLIYANMMLAMTNYACGYLKENNNNNGFNLFEYHNLKGMSEVTPTVGGNIAIKKGVDSTEIKEALKKQINDIKSNIRNLKQNIKRINLKITDKNPNKERLEETKKDKEEKLQNAQRKEFILQMRVNDYNDTYDDYSEFFRYIRNSIAHGNYSIDYIKALKSKDFSKMQFTFRDYEENDKNKENPCFEVVLSAKKLGKIVNGIKEKVNAQLNIENSATIINQTKITEIMNKEEFLNCSKPFVRKLQKAEFVEDDER